MASALAFISLMGFAGAEFIDAARPLAERFVGVWQVTSMHGTREVLPPRKMLATYTADGLVKIDNTGMRVFPGDLDESHKSGRYKVIRGNKLYLRLFNQDDDWRYVGSIQILSRTAMKLDFADDGSDWRIYARIK